MDTQPILEVRGLGKKFGSKLVLQSVDLTVRTGEVMFLIGPSGSGKSTCLRCINCLEKPTHGSLSFDGVELYREENGLSRMLGSVDLRLARAKMPMVFQHFNLFEHLTVLRNLTAGPIVVLKLEKEVAIARAKELLKTFGLADLEDRYPSQISGGQKQRVGIARAMAMSPRMILLDEPTSSLDPELVADVLEAIKQLAASGMTMIIVTHEMAFARQIADTICFFDSGRIIERGPPDHMLNNPTSPRLLKFIKAILR
jgi:ABC-type polar amino acid transport system ATPase subunit